MPSHERGRTIPFQTSRHGRANRIVVIGDALVDVLIDDDDVLRAVGGAGLNVAEGLTTLGHSTTLIATIGDDQDGKTIRSYLAERGVRLLSSHAELGTSIATSRREDGNPTYSFNDAARHRRVAFTPEHEAALRHADMVVVTCFPFDDEEQSEILLRAIAGSGTPVAVDPNPREGMLHDAAAFVRNFERIASKATLVKVGSDDSALLYGTDVASLRSRLHQLGTSVVLATDGANGASLLVHDGTFMSASATQMDGEIVDTMGAGDAALASAVSNIIEADDSASGGWVTLLTDALRIAAATCRHRGPALVLPDADELTRTR